MLVCCSVEDIFAAIENDPEPSATKYLVRASYLQIYNEVSAHMPAGTDGRQLTHAIVAVNCALLAVSEEGEMSQRAAHEATVAFSYSASS
jgi:hypothetical protein